MPCSPLHLFKYNGFQRGIDPNVDDPTKCHVSSFKRRYLPADFLCRIIQRYLNLKKIGQNWRQF